MKRTPHQIAADLATKHVARAEAQVRVDKLHEHLQIAIQEKNTLDFAIFELERSLKATADDDAHNPMPAVES